MMINISIFWHFFILGLFSFGGPIAHIGYFRKKFVEELKWLNDEEFSKIVALSQFLGPFIILCQLGKIKNTKVNG